MCGNAPRGRRRLGRLVGGRKLVKLEKGKHGRGTLPNQKEIPLLEREERSTLGGRTREENPIECGEKKKKMVPPKPSQGRKWMESACEGGKVQPEKNREDPSAARRKEKETSSTQVGSWRKGVKRGTPTSPWKGEMSLTGKKINVS